MINDSTQKYIVTNTPNLKSHQIEHLAEFFPRFYALNLNPVKVNFALCPVKINKKSTSPGQVVGRTVRCSTRCNVLSFFAVCMLLAMPAMTLMPSSIKPSQQPFPWININDIDQGGLHTWTAASHSKTIKLILTLLIYVEIQGQHYPIEGFNITIDKNHNRITNIASAVFNSCDIYKQMK